MPGFVIKELPEDLHQRLKERAARNHRSMTKEAIAMLEAALNENRLAEAPPPPYAGKFNLTDKFINRAKREGRE